MTSISLYLHIPFCRQACAYCDFYFVVSPQAQEDFFTSLHNEIKLYHRFHFSESSISSIYFGGGTPSWVSPHHITETLALINNLVKKEENCEITLEANPDDLSEERIETYLKAGVNRVSLGIQSFDSDTLKYLGRGHNCSQADNALRHLACSYGKGSLRSWSVDLIYGVPGNREWQEELNCILSFSEERPPHLSLYALTVEPGTPLGYQIKEKKKPFHLENTDEIYREEYFIAIKTLREKGYQHYEISNYALPGHRSEHNTKYWENLDYWGVGPGAHSYFGGNHYYNRQQLTSYIHQFSDINIDKVKKEDFVNMINKIRIKEILTLKQSYNQYLMVRLRTSEGVEWQAMEEKFPTLFNREQFMEKSKPYLNQGLLVVDDTVRINEEGWLFADAILQDLFL